MGYSRLSLSMDDSIVEKARRLSDMRGVSISKMFVSFVLKTESESADDGAVALPPIASQLKGILKSEEPLPADWDYRKELGDGRMERFGL